ncbi:hypothetical protein [Flavobacterium sp. 3HN19-14]|uniref:hypothetical protein n=1 Tax=Flavobacterium sp. 3HN19-14 TaxID=3448133 RepID=UPI003EE177A4
MKAGIVNQKSASMLIFLFINFIFALKYTSRFTDYYWLVSVLVVVFYAIIWYKRQLFSLLISKIKYSNYWLYGFYIIAALLLLYYIPKEMLNVDRWSVITSFWDNYFKGEYVYYAKSFDGNYPGPMPFYFILALPFYLIGELGIFSLSGILLFVFLMKKCRIAQREIAFLLTGISLFYLWELCSRSNLFVNGCLVLLSVVYFFKSHGKSAKASLIFGVIIGLLLSTRNVFVIPYIVTFLFALKTNKIDFKNMIFLGFIAVMTFGLTFLPFIYGHFDDFLKMNPFVIQSSFLLPFKYTLMFILLAAVVVAACKKESDIYFYAGLVLFLTILFHLAYTISKTSFDAALFGSEADISYFILCTPFLMYRLFLTENPESPTS